MMDRTDRHFRRLMRAITRRTLLYTEMVPALAMVQGRADLRFDACERPLALQLGGSDPALLAECARMGEALGFDEIDLNCGCPSPAVVRGRFGAVLMTTPELVAQCVHAMRSACRLPVTVKHRLGVDDRDSEADLLSFVDTVAAAGADRFIVHARKGWTAGLSPAQNRTIPPLRHDAVERLAQARPDLGFELNGGITSLAEARPWLGRGLVGVMIGRAAYDDPFSFADADRLFFGDDRRPTRDDVARTMLEYLRTESACGTKATAITRHLVGLFRGLPGGKRFRRVLSEHAHRPGAGVDVLERALSAVYSPSPTASR